MTAVPQEQADTLDAFVGDVRSAFDDAGDYIWKAAKLLEHETREELAKLEAYFPSDAKSRASRSRR
ncbi:MAG: hypothetical protein J0I07_35420 [Myxococcales bacterium]|nr:hypothetical protein [Myxococcales bacterium]